MGEADTLALILFAGSALSGCVVLAVALVQAWLESRSRCFTIWPKRAVQEELPSGRDELLASLGITAEERERLERPELIVTGRFGKIRAALGLKRFAERADRVRVRFTGEGGFLIQER